VPPDVSAHPCGIASRTLAEVRGTTLALGIVEVVIVPFTSAHCSVAQGDLGREASARSVIRLTHPPASRSQDLCRWKSLASLLKGTMHAMQSEEGTALEAARATLR